MLPARFLVTGAAGFLGAAVVDRLLARPDTGRVVGVDVRSQAATDPRHVAVLRDVTAGLDDLLDEHGIEAIVHHAYVIRPPRDREAARRVNVDATARLAEAARTAGVSQIVYPSSSTVYGAWPRAGPHTEEEAPRPLPGFAYSEDKVEAERVLHAAAGGGLSVVVLRGCVVAGPGASGFILDSLALPLFPVVAGEDPEMQFLHIDDYCDAVEAALEARTAGTFNVAGRGTLRVREMTGMLGSRPVPVPRTVLRSVIHWTWRLRLQNRSTEAGLDLITHPWLVSTAAARKGLGWEARHTSREAIAAWAEARRGRRRPWQTERL